MVVRDGGGGGGGKGVGIVFIYLFYFYFLFFLFYGDNGSGLISLFWHIFWITLVEGASSSMDTGSQM